MMLNGNRIYYSIMTLIAVISVEVLPVITLAQKDTFSLNLEIIQKDKRYEMKSGFNSLNIILDSFTLEFNSKVYTEKKYYSVQIAAMKDKADIEAVMEGEDVDNILFFVPGSGMASDKGLPYSSLVLTPEAHHYIIWELKGEKRAELVSQEKENIRLKWTITEMTFKSKTFTIPQSTFLTIYLVVFMDANLNYSLDKGEWSVVELNFR
jgi:hypothetical protein